MMKWIAPLESSQKIDLERKFSSNSETIGVGTFFETSRFECRKRIFDATKVTYNTYSCAISGMIRESMKMDDRDSAECKNWKRRDIMVILEFVLNDNKTKRNSDLLHLKKEKKKSCRGDAGSHFQTFRERGSSFSLSFCAIRPSVVFWTRRKAAIRGAGYAWTPDLRSFDKLRELGVSPYLSFTP